LYDYRVNRELLSIIGTQWVSIFWESAVHTAPRKPSPISVVDEGLAATGTRPRGKKMVEKGQAEEPKHNKYAGGGIRNPFLKNLRSNDASDCRHR
jgi:hypothetical protein